GSLAYKDDSNRILEFEKSLNWEDKQEVLFWRGASSGLGMNGPNWMQADRVRVSMKCKELGDSRFDAYLSKIVDYGYEDSHVKPYELGLVRDFVPFEEFLKYKYLLDVDGISCAWYSCFLKLFAESTVVKVQSEFVQWYYDRMQPWIHFVPVSPSLNEVPRLLNWLVQNDEECRKIARNGRELVSTLSIESEKRSLQMLIKEILSFERSS
ncbi:MAG: hypothetical protein KDD62_03985, partial [Bdellovibrionales bacterium]|nr:hypothetical protein [Bdellovibrionales bacterium]